MKAFVFPGQGAQFVGMGKDLYENNPVAKEMFDKANEILVVVLLLFGGRKIPELMHGIGKGVRSFKKGMNEIEEEINAPVSKTRNRKRKKGNNYSIVHYNYNHYHFCILMYK